MTSTAWDAIQKQLDSMPKPTQVLRLCADPDVRDRYEAAKQAASRAEDYEKSLTSAKDADKDALAAVRKQTRQAQDALKAAKADYDAHTVTLTFQALERGRLEALIKEHPPLEEDEEQGAEYHVDTFAPALIAAASVDGMPLEFAQQAMQTWPLDDWKALWGAAWSVQQRRRSDLGKG